MEFQCSLAGTVKLISKNNQNQTTESGLSVQSGNDSHVNIGVSPDQMREIMICIADQIPKYAVVAAAIVSERLKEFEDKIMDKFSGSSYANAEAFKDPDFQYMLNNAQHAYARSGDEEVGECLAQLVLSRSSVEGSRRSKLIMNRAIEIIPLLTKDELSILAIIFFTTRVKFTHVTNLKQLAFLWNSHLKSLMPEAKESMNSFQYMESLGLGRLDLSRPDDLVSRLYMTNQRSVVCEGLSEEVFLQFCCKEDLEKMIHDGILSFSSNGGLVSEIRVKEIFLLRMTKVGVDTRYIENLFGASGGMRIEAPEMIEIMQDEFPEISKLFLLYNSGLSGKFDLNSVGVAIGHANLSRVSEFNQKPDLWID